MKTSINTAKKPATYRLNWGNQIRMPAANCKPPNSCQTTGEIVAIKEQGGSKKEKNLSAPIIKKRRLQIAVIIVVIFISCLLKK